MSLVQIMMAASGVCYVGAAVGWLIEGKPWMAVTFVLYAGTALTLYLAGKATP